MRNVGFMGYARSGKDTAGDHLVQTYGYERVSFADPVRESLLALDPIVGDVPSDAGLRLATVVAMHGWEEAKDCYPEVRALLQRHGTDAVRGVIGDRTWIDIALRKAHAAYLDGVPVVVTDVRFPNEVEALREEGFLLVWVDRPGVEPVNGHASETGLYPHDADVVLPNNSSVDVLRERLDVLVR